MHSSQRAIPRRMGCIRDSLAVLVWAPRLKGRMQRHETTPCGGKACTTQGRRMVQYRRWALQYLIRALIGLFSFMPPNDNTLIFDRFSTTSSRSTLAPWLILLSSQLAFLKGVMDGCKIG